MQIYQFPELTEFSNTDLIPVSHSRAVYAAPYSALASALAGKTSATMYGNIANGTDLNTVTDPGVYQLNGAASYVNLPYGTVMWGILEVIRPGNSSAYIYQRITGTYARTYERIYANSSWGSWYEISKGLLIQRGSTNTTNVTFSTEYATTPTVTLTPVTTLGAAPIVAMVMDLTTAGFTIVKKYFSNGSWLDSGATVNWIAAGTRF